jgi:hypothetical protein
MDQPVWTPGKVVPAEPLGTGEAIPALDLPVPEPVAAVTPVPTSEPDFLATRSTTVAPSAAPPPVRPIPPPFAPARKPSAQRPKSGGGPLSERPAWLIPAAVAVAIVLILGTVGVIVLANRGNGLSPIGGKPSPSARPTTSPKASPSTSPTGGPQAVPVYAPTSATPVKSVQICTPTSPCNIPGASAEKATVCDLGSTCRLEVAMYFTTVQKSVVISYTLKFFDRCTGVTTDLPGTQTTTSSSGWIVGIPTDHLNVRLPAGAKSAALVAVSTKPGVAQSAPLLLGADTC